MKNIRVISVVSLLVLGLAYELDSSLGLRQLMFGALGRNSTLTDRTEIWAELLRFDISPVFGTGYDSLWLGQRLQHMWDLYWWHPNEAHNGYLEVYLELGMIGLVLFGLTVMKVFQGLIARAERGDPSCQFGIPMLLMYLLYNITEVAIKGDSLMWFFFLMVALQMAAPVIQRAGFVDNQMDKFPNPWAPKELDISA